jgi:hypothetical protein
VGTVTCRPQRGAGSRRDPHSYHTGLGAGAPKSLGDLGRCGLWGHVIPHVARPAGLRLYHLDPEELRACRHRQPLHPRAAAVRLPGPGQSRCRHHPRRPTRPLRPLRLPACRRHAGRMAVLHPLPRTRLCHPEGAGRRRPAGASTEVSSTASTTSSTPASRPTSTATVTTLSAGTARVCSGLARRVPPAHDRVDDTIAVDEDVGRKAVDRVGGSGVTFMRVALCEENRAVSRRLRGEPIRSILRRLHIHTASKFVHVGRHLGVYAG